MAPSEDFREMIKKYNEEIKKMQKKSKPILDDISIPTQSNDVKQTTDEKTQFQFKNDYSLPNISQNQMILGQTTNLNGEGYLIVKVTTSNSAAPIQGANVLISFDTPGGEELIKSVVTNQDGETKQISLPTVSSDESLEPGIRNPYASYSIRVSSDGYFTIDSINVPIFDKEVAVQPLQMIPLPEGFTGPTVLNSNDTGSITLN